MVKPKNLTANPNRIYKDVEFLTSIFPYRNYKNTTSLDRAAEYIRAEFEKTGLPVENQIWTAKGRQYQNIIGSYQPEKKKRLIVGAHYDVYYNQPGADDNASGVAGLLETARLIVENNLTPDYRIDFVAYSLEEPPFFRKKEMGSYIHAASMYESGAELIGMINYEMIGYYAGKDTRNLFPKGVKTDIPESNHFVGVISVEKYHDFHREFFENTRKANPLRAGFVSFPNNTQGPDLSDNRNYWHFGYPALMLNDGPSGRNPNYHKITDTIDTLNFEIMAEVVAASTAAVCGFK